MKELKDKKSLLGRVICTGLNYKTSAVHLREKVSLDEESKSKLYLLIKEDVHFSEALILSTCNRFEIYFVSGAEFLDSETLIQSMWNHLFSVCPSLSETQKDLLLSEVVSFKAVDAVRHAFSVVTSLDSLCLGETQVTGQFKKSYEESRLHGLSGVLLNHMSREALTLNRRVRNRTLLGKKNKSISHLAIDLALHIFKSIEKKSFALLGAGKMISLAYDYALLHQAREIVVLNRTKEKAKRLIRSGTRSSSEGLDQLDHVLLETDIVLSSTSSPEFVLDFKRLSRVQKQRNNQPLFLIDIALPRDIDPRCSEIENVYLFDLDDIRKVVSIKNKSYDEDILIAKNLIEERLVTFTEWLSSFESKNALNHFGNYLNELFSREEERTLRKKSLQGISRDQKEQIAKMLRSISRKILADTALSMKQKGISDEADEQIEIKIQKKFIKKGKTLVE